MFKRLREKKETKKKTGNSRGEVDPENKTQSESDCPEDVEWQALASEEHTRAHRGEPRYPKGPRTPGQLRRGKTGMALAVRPSLGLWLGSRALEFGTALAPGSGLSSQLRASLSSTETFLPPTSIHTLLNLALRSPLHPSFSSRHLQLVPAYWGH